jgi:outer membrane receptor for ferrienterochelin and colicins
MKKAFILVSACMIMASMAFSHGGDKNAKPPKTVSVSGTVIDKTNREAIAGALLKIEGTDIEVYTDLNGRFTINGMIPDTYEIKCTMISYQEKEEKVKIEKQDNKLEIQLQTLGSEN